MKNFCRLLSLALLFTLPSYALSRVSGWCEQGNQAVVTPGSQNSTTKVQRSYPACTVQVYLTGTLTSATIFANNLNPPTTQGNPFTAAANTGQWGFYAGTGTYDIQLSGGGLSTPYVISAVTVTDSSSNYPSLPAAIAGTPPGGTLTLLAGIYRVASTVTISGITILCQPGAVIQPSANVIMALIASNTTIDGCTFDGQRSQLPSSSTCIQANGGSNMSLRNLTVRNCGNFGIFFFGSTVANQHVKVLNSVFTGNFNDAVYSQGLLYDAEWAGNYADASTAFQGPPGNHTFAVHYQQAGTTPPHAIKIHDNVLIAGTNFAIEIGSFMPPYPFTSWPYDVQISHNTCFITFPGSGCDSLSMVRDFSIENDVFDSQGNLSFYMPEIIGMNGVVHGIIQRNCAASQVAGIVLNQSANIEVSGNSFCAQVLVGITGPAANIFDISVDNNRIHDNTITLPPGFTAAATTRAAAIWVQLNDNLVHLHNLDIHDNTLIGNSATDGSYAVLLENDVCTSTSDVDKIYIHHNTVNLLQYGLGNVTGCAITNIQYTDNLLGNGVLQFGGNFAYPTQSMTYRNLGFPSPVPINTSVFRPTACTTGTGLDAGGINCLASLRGGGASNAGAGTQTAYSGTLLWTTTTPATTQLFTLTMPPGAFTYGPICSVFSTYFNPPNVMYSISSNNTPTSVSFLSYGALPASTQVEIAWHCEPN